MSLSCITGRWGKHLSLHPNVSRGIDGKEHLTNDLIELLALHGSNIPSRMRSGEAFETWYGRLRITTRCSARGVRSYVTLAPKGRRR
jgi:hypothetical protein